MIPHAKRTGKRSEHASAVAHIDADANVIVASAPLGYDDARLRRAQALASLTEVGLDITRELLRAKLGGKAQVLARLRRAEMSDCRQLVETEGYIRDAAQQLAHVDTLEHLRLIEAQAAAAYWDAWSSIAVRFAKRDQARVPAHWGTFGTRRSPISGASRNAANPSTALLNYLYAILEEEAAIAARTVGLDPGIGILHADQRNRDSLACDRLEAVRPDVDAAVLNLLLTHTFSAHDFFENCQGVCRLLPPLTHLLAETAPRWTKAIAPIAEQVAKTLMQVCDKCLFNFASSRASRPSDSRPSEPKRGKQRHARLPTPLTQTNRSAGRAGSRRSSIQKQAQNH
jgi:CRISPR-associated endonuclease Cas1